ncbi:hypothetical protein BU17DRAFT_37271 [Hysterangium stoloniferum]|nr:hypothetical protein BU17DRAFT_37271 [Hysterangium stoloniferum]
MKSLRRSLNAKDPSNPPPISTPVVLPPLHKPPSAIFPPQKVIRALQPYRPQAPQELGFSKGDFFYVVSEVEDGPGWYEAHNPVSGARGLVPKSCFEELNKANVGARSSVTTQTAISPRSTQSFRSSGITASPRHQTFYAVVLHDFNAERTDELDARANEPITVVAQSNEEWFVAKPIGKLGRPGLIPASFVELRNPSTNSPLPDVAGIIARGELPNVEDWKRAMQEYKQSSIPLGVIDEKSTPVIPPTTNFPSIPPNSTLNRYRNQHTAIRPRLPLPRDRPPTPVSMQDPSVLPPGLLVSAEIVAYHFENEEYWFQINAVYQPDDVTCALRHLVLFRVYDDFYDFQVALLDAFPVEAGRQHGPPSPQSEGGPTETESSRILPYMPGPVTQVDDVVTNLRREELDDYLGQLCALRDNNAEHVLRHLLVRSFFAPKRGDSESELPPAPVSEVSQQFSLEDQYQENSETIDSGMAAMSLAPHTSQRSDDLRYEDDYGRRSEYGYPAEHAPSQNSPYAGTHTSSVASPSPSSHQTYSSDMSSYVKYNRTDSTQLSESGQSTPSTRQSNPISHPSISATNSQTAFLKIKIFHRRTDDLIAIRVNPRVSHTQLMEKVRERLGDDVQTVSYRSSLNGTFADLQDDYALRDWLDRSDKHVLYAL